MLIVLFRGEKKFIKSEKNDKIIRPKISCNEKDLILLPFSIKYPIGVYKKVAIKLRTKISNI